VGKKVKVVFDTNVWLSIFMKKILTDEYSQAKQELTVYVSKDILLEISKVLLYPKIAEILRKANVNKKEILQAIEANSIIVKPKLKLQIIDEDAEDNKIIECTLSLWSRHYRIWRQTPPKTWQIQKNQNPDTQRIFRQHQ
jgi:putative PIN family toxin of toxin-antitoxin system